MHIYIAVGLEKHVGMSPKLRIQNTKPQRTYIHTYITYITYIGGARPVIGECVFLVWLAYFCCLSK